ncbi:carbohydrate ABC transporter permease [Alkaliphilus peptidifermentans]|uniref:Raffinose/stachyose/melibiose transport system permease protein n=1 Tax=Alkaliphilus peptidifermentans DSM 18978 TaxID=1120976 RepID=A0A1G5KSL5_9FIRM|nr:carbohydrate ABC transporter permease [Alkaliphilus peptidifermentans]SCZ03161.1 raffinose/stachyose/melibiose transport system permease protein [Alkaliphilus peptidifermentans DSM 18978]
MNKTSTMSRIARSLIFIWFITYAICIIYPLLWMVISGFKTKSELFLNTWALPQEWVWGNYKTAWDVGVGRYFFNSVFVTSISVALSVIISAGCAFALSRFRFKGEKIILLIVIGGLMLSPQVSLISLYKLLQKLNIYNTYLALIIPYVAFRIPFTTFLIRSYLIDLPREVEDAAYIDGCNSWGVFWQIILPMSKPIISTASLLTAMQVWNEFMFALVFIEDSKYKTIPIGLMSLRSTLSTDWTVLLAGLTISVIPMIILFIVFQKQFVRGLTSGSVKG